MLDPENVPEVDSQELLSRFVLSKRHVRSDDGTLKADAFVPHPHGELSVTRHLEATDDEVWQVGSDVAEARNRTLYGRGDALAATYLGLNLSVIPDPVDGNPNHVDVREWPLNDKPAQKLIAQEIAAVARFVAVPDS